MTAPKDSAVPVRCATCSHWGSGGDDDVRELAPELWAGRLRRCGWSVPSSWELPEGAMVELRTRWKFTDDGVDCPAWSAIEQDRPST